MHAHNSHGETESALDGEFFEDAIDVSPRGFAAAAKPKGDGAAREVVEQEPGDFLFAGRQAQGARDVLPVRRREEILARVAGIEEIVSFFPGGGTTWFISIPLVRREASTIRRHKKRKNRTRVGNSGPFERNCGASSGIVSCPPKRTKKCVHPVKKGLPGPGPLGDAE